jgi:hypothetical protein
VTASTPHRQRRDAIRAGLRAPLPRLAAELQRVEADIHSLSRWDSHGRGRTRRRFRRSMIRAEVAWRSLMAALVPTARIQVTWRKPRPVEDRANTQVNRPLKLAAYILPPASRDRWTEEWFAELAMLRGGPRLRWTLSTLRGLIPLAYLLRRTTHRSAT